MNETIKIVLLHLFILAIQALYMYLSNKPQLKSKRLLFLIAIPITAAFPAILNAQDHFSYSLYEYSIIFCILTGAVADVILAAGYNKEYLTDASGRRLLYSYLMICMASAFIGNAAASVRALSVIVFFAVLLVLCFKKKAPLAEPVKAVPLAAFALACSWAFLRYIL